MEIFSLLNTELLCARFYIENSARFTIYHLPEVCLFTNVHEINQQYKQKPKAILTGLFKLFIACSSWTILKHCLNHIFHYHVLKIFELFQGTSKTLTFTLSIKTNAQIHLKMLKLISQYI